MSSNASRQLLFFPTPYSDEILYSVLCRYHSRCGSPSARQANLAFWGNAYGKRLYLPDGIENIAVQIPQGANLTAERFIEESTILPLLKPFLTRSKFDELLDAMKFGNPNIYNIVSFSKVFTLRHRRLRYCMQCIESDTQTYGETYWHRVHQLPGIYVCPTYGTATVESDVESDELRRDYYPLLSPSDNSAPSYEPDIAAKLLDLLST